MYLYYLQRSVRTVSGGGDENAPLGVCIGAQMCSPLQGNTHK